MNTFQAPADLTEAFASVTGLHPKARDALRFLLRQTSDRPFTGSNVLAALLGDAKVCTAIAEREAEILYAKGAMVVDCTGLSGTALVFGTEIVDAGVGSAKGPIITAWESGQPLVLKNFSKMMPGIEAQLRTALMFFSGELHEVTYQSELHDTSFTLSHDDRKHSFRLRVIDDPADFGTLSKSAQARLQSFVLPLTEKEISAREGERLAKQLTGGSTRDISTMPVLEIKK
jgi:hypothetical protein